LWKRLKGDDALRQRFGSPAAHPNYKHGMRSKEWTGMRKLVNELAQDLQSFE
jgi:hypothetical protein